MKLRTPAVRRQDEMFFGGCDKVVAIAVSVAVEEMMGRDGRRRRRKRRRVVIRVSLGLGLGLGRGFRVLWRDGERNGDNKACGDRVAGLGVFRGLSLNICFCLFVCVD